MSSTETPPPPETITSSSSPDPRPATRGQVVSWAMWDWGSAAFNAVIVTFVFSVYLTDSVGADLDSPLSPATWLSISIAVAGLVIALTAPVMGQRADRGGRRRRSLALWTYLTVALAALMFFVDSGSPYPWFFIGLLLLAVGSITFEFSYVALPTSLVRSAYEQFTKGPRPHQAVPVF